MPYGPMPLVGKASVALLTVEFPPANERRRSRRGQDALVRHDDLLQAVARRQLEDDLSEPPCVSGWSQMGGLPSIDRSLGSQGQLQAQA